jgi:hypothetical protein
LTGSALVDHVGRRRLLLMSTGALVVLLSIAASLLCNVNSPERGAAGISMIYLFMGGVLSSKYLFKIFSALSSRVQFWMDSDASFISHGSPSLSNESQRPSLFECRGSDVELYQYFWVCLLISHPPFFLKF